MPTTLPDLGITAAPDDADALREVLTDTAKMSAIFAEHGVEGWAVLNAHYAEAAARKDKGDIDAQILEQAEIRAQEIARGNNMELGGRLNLTPEALHAQLAASGARRGRHYSTDAPGHSVQEVYGSAGKALRAIVAAGEPNKAAGWRDVADLRTAFGKAQEIQAAYSSHIGPSGGYLMPESFRNDLLQIAHEEAVMRPRATTIPMGTPKVTLPAIHETNRSTTLFGGVQMYWTEEDADSTESEAAFKTVSLEPDTLTGYAEIPNETMQDTLAFSAYFDATFPRAMAFEEDYAFLQGNGVGRPLGVLNADALITVAARDGQPADSFALENALDMYARLLPTSMGRAVWLVNQELIPELGTMALSVGTGGAPVFMINAANGMPMSLLGRPIVFTEKVNGRGDAGDVALVDAAFYLIGDLQTVTVTSSEHYKFKERRTAFSIVERVDGQPWVDTPITPRHGTDTLSPFVATPERA